MPGAKPRLHLPYGQWPPEDRRRWEHAVSGDDPFADGAGAHLAATSRKAYLFGWRRFLGFLVLAEPEALEQVCFARGGGEMSIPVRVAPISRLPGPRGA